MVTGSEPEGERVQVAHVGCGSVKSSAAATPLPNSIHILYFSKGNLLVWKSTWVTSTDSPPLLK